MILTPTIDQVFYKLEMFLMLRARSDHAGIFPGMISHPSPEAVVNELGDKVVDAIVHAVEVAKEKFAQYRAQHPDWQRTTRPGRSRT
jgi:hypothetical protein